MACAAPQAGIYVAAGNPPFTLTPLFEAIFRKIGYPAGDTTLPRRGGYLAYFSLASYW
jgi:hypothetical protein